MPLMKDLKKVMIIGSGPIVIGQAAEFDYAGTQACRGLKELGLEVVLVNPNPATIMTDKAIADRIYIDPLVETQAANDTALLTFAEVCRAIREDSEEVHITSGLSNISFGMPARKSCNQAFMVLAVEAGMDSAIVDPLNRDMVGIMFATNALLGRDEMNVDYMGGFREGLFGPVQA